VGLGGREVGKPKGAGFFFLYTHDDGDGHGHPTSRVHYKLAAAFFRSHPDFSVLLFEELVLYP
jgi:hypothetical protein